MEIPSVEGVASATDRRSGDDRRDDGRAEHSRRHGGERRYATLERSLVSISDFGPRWFAALVTHLAQEHLLGPVFMATTAALFFFSYAFVHGWKIAAMLVFALIVHESGHFLATRVLGYRPHLWWFIPLLGAVMRLPQIKNRHDEAFIAFGGPLLGGVVALGVYGCAVLIPADPSWGVLLAQFAFVGAVLNLFNLGCCISPLDGGRVIKAVHEWLQLIGLVLLFFVSWFYREPSLLLLWIVVAVDRFMGYPVWRFAIVALLLALMAALMFFGTHETHHAEDAMYLASGMILVALCRPVRCNKAHAEEGKETPKGIVCMACMELPPIRMRIAWLCAWLSLTLALAYLSYASALLIAS